MNTTASIQAKLAQLPPPAQAEVLDFIDFMLQKQKRKASGKLRQDWANSLQEYRHQYTALELQKQGLAWRED